MSCERGKHDDEGIHKMYIIIHNAMLSRYTYMARTQAYSHHIWLMLVDKVFSPSSCLGKNIFFFLVGKKWVDMKFGSFFFNLKTQIVFCIHFWKCAFRLSCKILEYGQREEQL